MPPVTDLSIRPLAYGDAAAWRALWTGYLAFYDTTLAPAVFDATFARLLDPAVSEMTGLVACHGTRPVGLAHVIRHRHCWRPEDVLYLQDLFVAPDARGTGAGRALIEAVYAMGDRIGVPGVYWTTQEGNATARALYDRVGSLTPFIKYQRP